MLAVRRNVKARGRMKLLKTSTTTINLISIRGVPTGIKWAKKCFKELTQINKMLPIQKEQEKGKVTSMWEVAENKKGNKAKKL